MKLKWLIFFLHARSRSISSDWDLIFSCHWAFSSSAQHPGWLPAGGPGFGYMPRRRTVTSAAASLFVPHYENCRHLVSPDTYPKRKRNDGRRSEGRTEAELILVDTCCTGDITPHLTIYFTKWPEYILCKVTYRSFFFWSLRQTLNCQMPFL